MLYLLCSHFHCPLNFKFQRIPYLSPQHLSLGTKVSIYGAIVRYNRLLETNANLKCEQCDRSWGDGGGFFLRRIRLIFSGNIHPQVYFYLQPDLASSAATDNLNFAQIFRDRLEGMNNYSYNAHAIKSKGNPAILY